MANSQPTKSAATDLDPRFAAAENALRDAVSRHRGYFITLGVLLIVAGLLAIAFPVVSTISASIVVGWVLIASGIVQIVHAFSVKGWSGTAWSALIGAIYLIAGLLTAVFPLSGALSLTLLLSIAFLFEGGVEIAWALQSRHERGWGVMLVSGIAAVIVGAMIGVSWPVSALWAIGMLVGINLLFSGASFLSLAMAARSSATAPSTAA